MTPATAEREKLHQIIQNLPDEKIPAVLMFVEDFSEEEHIPNDETIDAILEGHELARIYCSRFAENENPSTER